MLDQGADQADRPQKVGGDGRFGVVQIAGLIARRIVPFVKEGDTIGTGERFGLIRFGSRVDVYLPVGVTINRPPRDGRMAFVRSPDLISIELLQKGQAKPPAEPWLSMPNTGVW
eukprot:gene8201-biopygen7296